MYKRIFFFKLSGSLIPKKDLGLYPTSTSKPDVKCTWRCLAHLELHSNEARPQPGVARVRFQPAAMYACRPLLSLYPPFTSLSIKGDTKTPKSTFKKMHVGIRQLFQVHIHIFFKGMQNALAKGKYKPEGVVINCYPSLPVAFTTYYLLNNGCWSNSYIKNRNKIQFSWQKCILIKEHNIELTYPWGWSSRKDE